MPERKLPAELGGKRVLTGIVDIRTEPGRNENLRTTMVLYDLPPSNRERLGSGDYTVLLTDFPGRSGEIFSAQSNDAVSIVLSVRDKPIAFYNHATKKYGNYSSHHLRPSAASKSLDHLILMSFALIVIVGLPFISITAFLAALIMAAGKSPLLTILQEPHYGLALLFASSFAMQATPVLWIVARRRSWQRRSREWIAANCAPQVGNSNAMDIRTI